MITNFDRNFIRNHIEREWGDYYHTLTVSKMFETLHGVCVVYTTEKPHDKVERIQFYERTLTGKLREHTGIIV